MSLLRYDVIEEGQRCPHGFYIRKAGDRILTKGFFWQPHWRFLVNIKWYPYWKFYWLLDRQRLKKMRFRWDPMTYSHIDVNTGFSISRDYLDESMQEKYFER